MAISNASNQIVKVNLIPGIIPSVLHLSQYDTGAGRPITFSVYDGSQAFAIPSGVSIAFEGTKPDGNGFSFTCSKSGNSALLTNYTNQMTALPGKIMCQLVFTDTSGGRVGSLPVLMVVTPAGINGDTVISDSDIEAIVAAQNQYAALNARLDAAIDQVNTMTNEAIDQMNTTTNKAVDQMNTMANDLQNQYAVTNAKLDTAISAVTQDSEVQDIRVKADGTSAATAGNAVREQITELKNDLDEDFDDAFEKGIVMLFNRYNTTDGFIMTSGEVRESTTLCYSDYVPVVAGKTIYFSDNGVLNVARFVTAYDANKNVLSDKGLDYGNTYIVPDGVAYIRVTFVKSYTAFQAQYDRVTDTRSYRIIKDGALPDSVIGVLADTEKIKNNTDYLIENTISKVILVDNGDINTGLGLGTGRRWFYANAIPANAIIDDITFKAASNYTNGKDLLLEFWEERTAGTLTKVDEIRYIPASANAVCTIPLNGRITLYPTYISFTQSFTVLLLTQGSNPNVKQIQDITSSSIAISALNDFNGDLDIDLSYHVYSGGNDGNIVHVGNGYAYTEIQDALDAITDDSAENPYTIIVHPKSVPYTRFSTLRKLNGTYPWTNAPIRYISIIGLDRYHCIVQDDSGNYNTPPAEILINGLVKNMTFVATHNDQDATATKGAYAVHIDAEPVGNVGYDMQFEDCVLKSDQTAGVGIGLHNACHLSFSNCDFISTASESYAPHDGYTNLIYLGAFNCHSSTKASDTDQVIKLTNCRAISKENRAYNLSTSVDSYMTLMAFCNTFWCEGTAQANGYKGSYCTIYGANHGNNASVLNA